MERDENMDRVDALVKSYVPYGSCARVAPYHISNIIRKDQWGPVQKIYWEAREYLFPRPPSDPRFTPRNEMFLDVRYTISEPLDPKPLELFLQCNARLREKFPEDLPKWIKAADQMTQLWAYLGDILYTPTPTSNQPPKPNPSPKHSVELGARKPSKPIQKKHTQQFYLMKKNDHTVVIVNNTLGTRTLQAQLPRKVKHPFELSGRK